MSTVRGPASLESHFASFPRRASAALSVADIAAADMRLGAMVRIRNERVFGTGDFFLERRL
jgi:hypothetical protein